MNALAIGMKLTACIKTFHPIGNALCLSQGLSWGLMSDRAIFALLDVSGEGVMLVAETPSPAFSSGIRPRDIQLVCGNPTLSRGSGFKARLEIFVIVRSYCLSMI